MAKSRGHSIQSTPPAPPPAPPPEDAAPQKKRGLDGYQIALIVWLLGFAALLVWLFADLILGLF